MNFPEYDMDDLKWSSRDGTIEISEFATFVDELLDSELLEHDVEIGIVKSVQKKGTKGLTPNQAKVLDKITQRYNDVACELCGDTIDLSEVLYSLDNGGYCSHCSHQMNLD
jgi:hypothetical protein